MNIRPSSRPDLGPFTVRFCRAALLIYWPALAVSTHFPNLNIQRPDIAGFGFDKWLHFSAFGLLTTLLIGACLASRMRRFTVNLAAGVLAALIYAPLDEWTQRFVAGREASWSDLRGNAVGIAMGTILAVIFFLASRRLIGEPMPPASNVEGDAAFPAPLEPTSSAKTVPSESDSDHSFVGGAMVVSVLTFISRITGLIRDSYLAGAFGLGGIADAYTLGFLAPNLFRRLFGEGALTAAFIPAYTDLLKVNPELSRRFASLCLALTAVLLGLLTIIGEVILWGSLHARPWPEESELAIRLIMVTLPYMPMVCLVAVFGSMLQVHGRFGPSAGMPILLNVVMIVGMWVSLRLKPDQGTQTLRYAAFGVCVSVVIAGVVQVFSQGAVLSRYFKFTTIFAGTHEAFRGMLKVLLPMLLALSVFQINTALDNVIAFALSPQDRGPAMFHFGSFTADYPIKPGGVRALANASMLYQFPLGVFGLAIATAIFPALAHAAAETGATGAEKFCKTLRQGLRLTVFIGLPASVGLLMVGLPTIRVFYEHHKITLDDSLRIAEVLTGFAPAIWAYSMTHVVTRAFYALKDSRTPLVVSVIIVMLNLVLNLILVWPLGAAGLAWSTCICAILQNAVLLWRLGRKVDRPIDMSVLRGWTRSALLSLAMAAALWPIIYRWDPAKLSRKETMFELGVMIIVGAVVFLGGAWITRAEEIQWLRRRG